MVLKILLTIVSVAGIAVCAPNCPPTTQAIEAKLKSSLKDFGDLMTVKDVPGLMKLFHPDITQQWPKHKTVRGVKELEDYFEANKDQWPIVEFQAGEILDERDDQVVATYTYKLICTDGKTLLEQGKGSSIYKCVNGELKIFVDVCNADPLCG